MKTTIKHVIAFVVSFCASAFVSAHVAGCSPAATAEEARDTYAAQQMKCVTDARRDAGTREEMRAEIDGCRARVKETWGRDPAKDGGAK